MKLEKEKREFQKEIDELEDDNRRWRSNQEYMNGLLEREERATRYQCNKVRELEEEIKVLKNTPIWKKLWNDIKPKWSSSYRYDLWKKIKDIAERMGTILLVCSYMALGFLFICLLVYL